MEYVTGIILAFFLSLLLFSKKGKTEADKILATWLLFIGIHLLLFYLCYTKFSLEHAGLLGIEIPLPLVHGPFLYLYTASLTGQDTQKKWLKLVHFIPAVICWVCMNNFFTFTPAQKVFVYQNKGAGFELFNRVKLIAIILSGILYICLSVILLNRHKRSIAKEFSYTERINLKWLQYLIYGISIIWAFIFISDKMVFWGVVLFVLFIGYFGIKQVGIFTHVHNKNEEPETPDPLSERTIIPEPYDYPGENVPVPVTDTESTTQSETVALVIPIDDVAKKKYAKSGLSDEMAKVIHRKLSQLMDNEKIYREGELSLSELAEKLSILPNYLSQVINEMEGKNFYDYINALRVQEFIRLTTIPENTKYTILSLAFDCGFNSKSSFNKNFKKVTGQSPSKYLNSLNKAA